MKNIILLSLLIVGCALTYTIQELSLIGKVKAGMTTAEIQEIWDKYTN